MSYVIYVIDTETTGIDSSVNEVVEGSFWRSSDDDHKTWLFRVFNEVAISDKALKINGHKKEDILHKTAFGRENYKNPLDIIPEIEAWVMTDGVSVEDRVFGGQNAEFDYEFLRALWKSAGSLDTFPFSKFILDTMQLTRLIDVCTGRRRSRYNLSSLVKDFGISKAKAHRAAGDVKMTRDLLMKQLGMVRDFISETFKDCYTE